MRINAYQSLSEFTSQYIGEWAPSDGHWFGLEFKYMGKEYRLHTGIMYDADPRYTADGREVLFGLYEKKNPVGKGEQFTRLCSFASMNDLLEYSGINGRAFKEVIMDDSTEITGQD